MYNARIKVKETHNVALQETLSFSLDRVIAGRVVRMLIAIAGAAALIYLVVLVPGMIVLALPGGVVAASKVYDEARLVRYLKYGDPIKPGNWEDADILSEMARIRASHIYDISKQFAK
jgi:hypothetical protein